MHRGHLYKIKLPRDNIILLFNNVSTRRVSHEQIARIKKMHDKISGMRINFFSLYRLLALLPNILISIE